MDFSFDQADNFKLFQTRYDTGRRHVAFRCNDSNFFTNLYIQSLSQILPQNNIEFARLQIIKTAYRHFFTVFNDLFFFIRQNPADLNTLDLTRICQQCLSRNIRCRLKHLFASFNNLAQALPAFTVAVIVITHFGMRSHFQKLPPYVSLKARHDRQYDNQSHHTECNTHNRNDGDKRHEAIAFFCPQIAQSYPSL